MDFQVVCTKPPRADRGADDLAQRPPLLVVLFRVFFGVVFLRVGRGGLGATDDDVLDAEVGRDGLLGGDGFGSHEGDFDDLADV